MEAMSCAAVRERLADTMDRVCGDHSPIIITRTRHQSVVLLSLEDFESLQETGYLLQVPANAKRRLESIPALENGQGIAHEINLGG